MIRPGKGCALDSHFLSTKQDMRFVHLTIAAGILALAALKLSAVDGKVVPLP